MKENFNDYKVCINLAIDNAKERMELLECRDKNSNIHAKNQQKISHKYNFSNSVIKYNSKIVSCKTIRDKNKLALSSRNLLLKKDNLIKAGKIAQNLIEAAWKNGAKRLLFLGSSCIYPKNSQLPIREE